MGDEIDVSTEMLQKILQWGVEDYLCTKPRVEALVKAVLEARAEVDRLGETLLERNMECNEDLQRVIDLENRVQDMAASLGDGCCLIAGRCKHGTAG